MAATNETLRYTLNGADIPDPVPSASNAQLREDSFTANSSSGGQYLLMLSKFQGSH